MTLPSSCPRLVLSMSCVPTAIPAFSMETIKRISASLLCSDKSLFSGLLLLILRIQRQPPHCPKLLLLCSPWVHEGIVTWLHCGWSRGPGGQTGRSTQGQEDGGPGSSTLRPFLSHHSSAHLSGKKFQKAGFRGQLALPLPSVGEGPVNLHRASESFSCLGGAPVPSVPHVTPLYLCRRSATIPGSS